MKHVSKILEDANIKFEYHLDDLQLNEIKQHEISMLIKEFINNIIKHSQATEAKLNLSQNSNHVKLEVMDNGKGINLNTKLQSIETRVKAMDGHIQISNLKHGLKITVQIEV